MLHTNSLFASLIWSSIGVGYFVYGKKQQSIWPMFGGIGMIVLSYVTSSVLTMSLSCLGVVAAVYFLVKRGY